jgi:hypothetical protein
MNCRERGLSPLLLLCTAATLFLPLVSHAQSPAGTVLDVAADESVDRWRLGSVRDTAEAHGLLLRSTSTLLWAAESPVFRVVDPRVTFVHNSALPFGRNDGWMWAGRGPNVSAAAGVALRLGPLRIVAAPEFVYARNDSVGRDSVRFYQPDRFADRSRFTLPWYTGGPFHADYPFRMGDEPISRATPGQSSVALRIVHWEVGASSENHWWGPGLTNALVLSNNAPGFPHLFFRSAYPLRTALGDFDFRWLVGGLTESDYFDSDTTNDLRSIAAGAVTFRPWWAPTLTLGATRAVIGTATDWNVIAGRWFDVFRHVPPTNAVPKNDSALYPGGREQVTSLFARYRLPRAGVETYLEWGRAEAPRSFRDFLVSPNHTQAYTLGLQWRSSPADRFWRVQAEYTSTEQSPTFRDRPLGVWYTSRRVIQGYTNRGQSLGAAVGPGAQGQWLAADWFTPATKLGFYLGRTRNNEDVRSLYDWPVYQAYCTHDVTMYGGVRASAYTPAGYVAIDGTLGNRINLWFQVGSGCPRGDAMIDVRNRTLSITVQPFARRTARR